MLRESIVLSCDASLGLVSFIVEMEEAASSDQISPNSRNFPSLFGFYDVVELHLFTNGRLNGSLYAFVCEKLILILPKSRRRDVNSRFNMEVLVWDDSGKSKFFPDRIRSV